MKAVVMAGGEGSRLRPLTLGRPKPMVPLVNKPVIAHIFDLLRLHGVSDVIVTVQYMAERIQRDFGDGQTLGMKIHYLVEDKPLGTAGSVRNARSLLDETFLVVSGDALTDIDLGRVVRFHNERKAKATLTLYSVPNPLEYGVVIIDDEGRIKQFVEKPSWGQVVSDTVNTGIYVLEPDVLDTLEPDAVVDFSKDLFPLLMTRGDPLYGYVASGYWCDIGDLQEYMRATGDLLQGRVSLGPLAPHVSGSVWQDDEVELSPDAQLYGPVYLGRGAKVKEGVIIHGPAVIRNHTVIDARAHIERSVIWRNSYIGEAADIRGAIVGHQCNIKNRAVLFEGVVVGDDTTIGEQAVVHSNVKIWPGKEVESGAIVKSSIIWGSQGRKGLFSRFGVSGVANVDLTPEMAARLGAAYGATLPRGSVVTINRDPHRSPRMLKRAIVSGLPSAGVNVLDLQSVPIPVARFFTRFAGAAGGVHVRLSPFDPRVVDIRLFDHQGIALSKDAERSIERIFFREDFRRVYLDEIGTISYASNVAGAYRDALLKTLDAEVIRKRKFRIVVDYASATTSQVLPDVLNDLICDSVGLNARVDETRLAISEDELQRGIDQLATICAALKVDFGVRLDPGGERIYLVDDTGKVVPPISAAAALADLALAQSGGGTIMVPVSAPTLFDDIASRRGGRVVRTKMGISDLMLAVSREASVLATDCTGQYIFHAFQNAPDAIMALGKLMEVLARAGARLSQVLAELPAYHMEQISVTCPREAKGKVMRKLHEQYSSRRTDPTDGLKVWLSDRQWVLVVPDPDRPLFHIHAEGESEVIAKELAQRYQRIVESLRG